jgi:hypothetical protein
MQKYNVKIKMDFRFRGNDPGPKTGAKYARRRASSNSGGASRHPTDLAMFSLFNDFIFFQNSLFTKCDNIIFWDYKT